MYTALLFGGPAADEKVRDEALCPKLHEVCGQKNGLCLPKFSPANKHKAIPSLLCFQCTLATVATPEEAVGPEVVVIELLIKLQGMYYKAALEIRCTLVAKRNRQSSPRERSLREVVLRDGLQGMGQDIVMGHRG